MSDSSYINVDSAIASAKQAIAEKNRAMVKVAIVRTDLRNAVTMGAATKEQRDWIEGTFPLRERKRKPASVTPTAKAA